MALLDGALARVFGAAFAGTYLPATLQRVTFERQRGGSLVESVAELPCRAQVDAASEAMGAAAGEPEVRVLILAASLASGAITTDDRLVVGGRRYAVAQVDRDPAGALFILRCRHG